ncbi:putative to MEROPS metallopeptidase family M20A [Lyophyllum shimeji]|uniref:To MEROPS metallopeptidase family M20A n=1 Tax=Lyophyllum shimeji TaxID=47721 RepID=A0A9P3UNN6_LYOSH|nr:putative to MEROPS metallopeptidase family M20A [Lyophyllum shimeji]
MEQPLSEKKSAGPLLPSPLVQHPKRTSALRSSLRILSVFLLCGYACMTLTAQLPLLVDDLLDKHESRCPQSDPLVPERNGALWKSLNATFGTESFKAQAVDWLGGAVRVPTESFDDMGPVGEDRRWEAFAPFHDYLLAAFPLVHSTLQLTKVNTYGLLYVWQGSDASLKPIVLAGHQDVVPVNPMTVYEWIHPPYSGHYDGRKIWGRGSLDDKSGLIGSLSSVESLLARGFAPTRTVVLAYGFDEEISGTEGAQNLAAALLGMYGKDGVAMIVDEGGGFAEEYGSVIATPGIAEKGYLDVKVEITTPGGHSSVPPKHTGIGMLSALLVEYEGHPYKAKLTRQDPLYSTFLCLGEHAKEVPKDLRATIRRSWSSKKALRQLQEEIFKNPVYKSFVGTTQAVDLIQGGVKANALPEKASAVVNHRIAVISSVEEVKAHDSELLKGLAERFNLTYNAFGTKVSKKAEGAPSSGSLTLSDAFGTALQPAPVTPTGKDAAPYQLLSGTIKASYNSHRGLTGTNEIIVSPGMPSGNTDTRYYWDLTRHIFRYNHHNAGKKTNRLSGVHTVNEAIEVDTFVEIIRFFTTLILNADEATTL